MITPVCAFEVSTDRVARELSSEEMSRPAGENASYRWLHFHRDEEGLEGWLAQRVDPVVAALLVQTETRPRAELHGTGAMVNLRGINMNPGADPEDMVSLRIWVDENLIVTVRRRQLIAVDTLRDRIEKGMVPSSPSAMFAVLAAGLTERTDTVALEMVEQLDDLEDKTDAGDDSHTEEVIHLRRVAAMLRRYIAPQREAINRLTYDGDQLFERDDMLKLREVGDQITRIVEELDAIRERAAAVLELAAMHRAENMNHNMYLLSVIAAVFLPLGFITGLLGVNVAGIPGQENPLGFWFLCLGMTGLAIGLLLIFRRLKWL